MYGLEDEYGDEDEKEDVEKYVMRVSFTCPPGGNLVDGLAPASR